LTGERQREARDIEAPLLAKYDQLLKMRKMLAVASLDGDICSACHVRLRPVVAQHVRRGTEIVTCDSCQRILYAVPKAADAPADAPGAPS
jgi:predicted  nucleic acid-binding Zn-ribbon protein